MGSAQAKPDTTATQKAPLEDNLLILGMKVDYLNLDEVVPAYRIDTEILLPLGILSQILDIAIRVDLGTASADGFILREDRQFHLDVNRHETTINGQTTTYEKDQVFIYPDDIYVNTRQLEKWLPLKFDINLFTSKLLIKTTEKLPFQKRLHREKQIAKIRSNYRQVERDYPYIDSPYELISMPFLDQRISANYLNSADGKSNTTYYYTTHLKADMLYHETSLYLTGNSEESELDALITASRSDPDARLLGPLHATSYTFLNVSTPGLDFVSINQSGIPGVTVSNYPLKQQTHYDRHTFEGELLPDWEVELYHNNALIAYLDVPVDGKYRFEDIPLLFGHNYFKLVFYGPLGQIREETQTFSLTSALVKPGTYHYQFSITGDEGSDIKRRFLRQDIGLYKNLSAQLNFASIPVPDTTNQNADEQRDYTNLALNGFLGSMFYRYNFVKDMQVGDAREFSLQSRFGRTNLSGSIAKFNDFRSEQLNSSDPLSQRTTYRIDSMIPAWWLPAMPLGLEITKDIKESGNEVMNTTGRISMATKGLAVTNSLTRSESSESVTREHGVLQLSTHNTSFSLRSELYYDYKPETRLNTISLNFAGRYFRPYRFNIGLTKFTNEEYQYLLGINKTFGKYSLLVNTTYKTTNEWGVNMAFAISLGQDPRQNYWHTQSTPMASMGNASILVFFDKNQNGIRDEGEEGLKNVGFRFNESLKIEHTDENGIAFIPNLPRHASTDVSIDVATLEDPLMVPLKPGFKIVPRPGHITQLDIPVISTGEIDGIIYLRKNGKNIPIGNIEIELTDASGTVLKKIKSAYDGFYVISKIPAGEYLMRISPEYATKNGLKQTLPREITIHAENPFVSGVNFILLLTDKKDQDIHKLKP